MSAEPGDSIVYHRGFLSIDRKRAGDRAKQLEELAAWVLLSSERRSVVLLQRRHADGDYEYIAQKARGRDGWKFTPKFRKGMEAA